MHDRPSIIKTWTQEIEVIVKEIEDKILEPHINQITGSDVGQEYKKILCNNKKLELWVLQQLE